MADRQIMRMLKQAEALSCQGKTMEEIYRALGISDSTCCKWSKENGGIGIDQVGRLRKLEKENNRLKRPVAALSSDVRILKDIRP